MGRVCLAVLLGCAAVGPVAAQPRQLPRRVLDAPQFTIRPQGALPTFTGEGVTVVVGWRPVFEAVKYRVTLTDSSNKSIDFETTDLRIETKDLRPNRYQVVVTAIDRAGNPGNPSDPLPINVIEIRAIPPGATQSVPPTRGAYAVGTRFSVASMHCELNEAPIDDLLVAPENELRVPMAGAATLRCAGIPGYLEKPVVITPIMLAVHSAKVRRGETTTISVTLASVAELGQRLDVLPIGDITLGNAKRTDFGIDVPVTVEPNAKSATLSIQSGGFELGRVELAVVDAPPPPLVPRQPVEWAAADLGGFAGVFLPPTTLGREATIGRPTNPSDTIRGGPLVGLRLGFFPIRRVGLEGEVSAIAAGYADESGVAHLFTSRAQVAVRAVESGRVGLRLIGGVGTITTLRERGTSQIATQGEVHGGIALTVETSPNLWLRFQVADVVTTALDEGYAHCVELQLGILTRAGRRDSF